MADEDSTANVAPRRRGQGGRPSKGERYVFLTRVPEDLADAIIAAADEAGMTRSDFISHVLRSSLLPAANPTPGG